jgi:endonuclease/exonuclease/phosphatase (EEP) superfamily protein YafD
MRRRLLTCSIAAGGLLWLLVLAAIRLGRTSRPWPLEVLDTFALYAFAPFLALGLAALLLRSRLLVGVVLLAGVLFWQEFGHVFLPGPAIAAPAGPSLRVLTYNVLVTNKHAGALAELVRAEQPDVVVLQELSSPFAEDLTRRLGGDYPYRDLVGVSATTDGAGTFSRLPLLDVAGFRLSREGNPFQRVHLELDGREIVLYNVHLATPRIQLRNPPGPIPRILSGFVASTREQELRRLIDETAGVTQPLILAGDFNLAAGSRPYRSFPASWRDAYAERGWGFGHTFPTHYRLWWSKISISVPLIRIDYVLSSPEITPLRARVAWIDGSDHLPLLAELQLPPR